MQTSAPNFKKWLVPVGVVAGLIVVLLLSNREVPSPTGLPMISDLETYKRDYANAANEASPLFEAFDNGDEISDAGKATLRKCGLMFDTVNSFIPNKAGPYLDAGRAYLAAGDLELADARLQQCLNNSRLEGTDIPKEGIADANRLMSMVRGGEGRWPEAYDFANRAVKDSPQIASNYVARASAEVQLNKVAEAKADVAKAMSLEAGNKRAQQLQLLLQQAGK